MASPNKKYAKSHQKSRFKSNNSNIQNESIDSSKEKTGVQQNLSSVTKIKMVESENEIEDAPQNLSSQSQKMMKPMTEFKGNGQNYSADLMESIKEIKDVQRNLFTDMTKLREQIHDVQQNLLTDMTKLRKQIKDVQESLSSVTKDMGESRKEIKDAQQNLFAYQSKSKKEIENVQQNLTKVSKEIEEWNATTLQMPEKIKRIEQRVLALPSPVEIVWNSVRKDIFVAGGYPSSSLKSAEIFNWKEKKWIKFASMENGHGGASSFIKNNTLFVAGGYGCKSVDKINLNQLPLTFQTFPGKLPYEWNAHQTVVYEQKVLYIGGFIVGKETSGIIYKVQISGTEPLEKFCDLPEPRQEHKAVLVDDKVLIFGGCGKRSQPLSSVLEFDPKIPEFKEMTPLPHPLIGMATVPWRDQVVLLGGYDGSETLNSVIMYDSKTGKSMPIPSMLEKRSECCAVIIGDTIVVMGGKNDEVKYLKTVEYFTMGSSSSWEYLPSMNEPRKEAIAEVLPFEQKYV